MSQPGDSKWPFDPLVGGHLTFPKGHLTIPKRAQRIARKWFWKGANLVWSTRPAKPGTSESSPKSGSGFPSPNTCHTKTSVFFWQHLQGGPLPVISGAKVAPFFSCPTLPRVSNPWLFHEVAFFLDRKPPKKNTWREHVFLKISNGD